jgi:hypothetical protein
VQLHFCFRHISTLFSLIILVKVKSWQKRNAATTQEQSIVEIFTEMMEYASDTGIRANQAEAIGRTLFSASERKVFSGQTFHFDPVFLPRYPAPACRPVSRLRSAPPAPQPSRLSLPLWLTRGLDLLH